MVKGRRVFNLDYLVCACRSIGYSGNYISQTLPFANTACFAGERKHMHCAGYGAADRNTLWL